MAIPGDPQLTNQWHLRSVNLYTNAPGNPSVWDDYTGAGVNIGVYDNGVQSTHFELDGNYNAALEYAGAGAIANTAAVGHHGTAVAGVIAAEANGSDTVGVAYDARVTGVTLWTATNAHWSDAFFTGVMTHQANFDIVNHSWGSNAFGWGPTGSWYQIVSAQMEAAAANGRGGLGTIMVSAAGNDRHGEQSALNGPAIASDVNVSGAHVGSRHSITVAGYGQDGFVADYSNPGSNILVSAPAAGRWNATPVGQRILATDKVDDATPGFQEGADGFHTGNFGELQGTSFSAPIVSGVVALMLEANPNLGWRNVKEILASSAVHLGSAVGATPQNNELHEWFANGARTWNGGGHNFSEDYGFGGVDALAAVRLAETWTEQNTSANEEVQATGLVGTGMTLPDNNGAGLVYDFNLSAGLDVETMVVHFGITHTWAGDLQVTLTSPSGTQTTLLSRVGSSADVNGLRLTSNAFLGESSEGTWRIQIADLAASDVGNITSVHLRAYGSADSPHDTCIFTNEYASLSAVNVWRSFLDGNDGQDMLNAAAVTGSCTIDLRGTATGAGSNSSIGGAVLRILGGVEDAVTGDGNDLLIGSNDANWLRGMRGSDQLNGNDGNDRLEGGIGDDRLYGGGGHDRIEGGADLDVLLGEDGEDILNGDDGADILNGGADNDRLEGDLGADVLTGGMGLTSSDTFVFDTAIGPTANVDTITDFESAYDQIFLDDLIFKGLGIGTTSGTAISNAMFAANIADIATSAANEAQIVYETDTGKLFYDADGQDGVAATQFALLSTMPTLTAANFAII